MRSTRGINLVLLALAAAAAGWLFLDTVERRGADPLPVPWTAPVGMVVLAAIVLVAAREVRRWVLGKRTQQLNPLTAARIAVLSTASSYVGAVLSGWYAAQALVILPALVGGRRERFTLAVVATLAALALAVAGLIGQRWCRRPPTSPDQDEPAEPSSSPPRSP
jgi:ABC-type Fe3+-siderophore transport system permease subunit